MRKIRPNRDREEGGMVRREEEGEMEEGEKG